MNTDYDYAASMKEIERERRTEEQVRAFDADDIVRWIHGLEDELEQHQSFATEEARELHGEIRLLRAALDEAREALELIAEDYEHTSAEEGHGDRGAAYSETARAALKKLEDVT